MQPRKLVFALLILLALFLPGYSQLAGASAEPGMLTGLLPPASAAALRQNAGPLIPAVYASPINGGCVQVTPSVCKLHLDPFTIQVAPDRRLKAFQLFANGNMIYDYRTDVSNPPAGNYTPSVVALDFAAACGETYTINLTAKDNLDANFLNAGQVENVVCPAGSYSNYLPLLIRD